MVFYCERARVCERLGYQDEATSMHGAMLSRWGPVQSIEAITHSSAILVPDDTSLTDRFSSIEHPRVTADIGHMPG